MLDDARRRRAVVLQHVFDQIDPAARAIELVAEQHIGWACCSAKSAMHAGPQDALGFRSRRVGKLVGREGCLHMRYHTPAYMRPGPRRPVGSKLSLTRFV